MGGETSLNSQEQLQLLQLKILYLNTTNNTIDN